MTADHASFDLRHYVELLSAAQVGGYRFATFDKQPEPGDLFLRHDVDFDPEAARVMSVLEHVMGVQATYLWMSTSELYSLDAPSTVEVVEGVRRRGHKVGWHPRRSDGVCRTRPDLAPLFAWHNPGPEYPVELEGWQNVMSKPWQADAADDADAAADPPSTGPDPLARPGDRPDRAAAAADARAGGVYRSDSNQHWRQGHCPCHALQARKYVWVHLLVHPEVWVYEGASMKETMLSMLAADTRRRRRQVAGDQIDWSGLLPDQVTVDSQTSPD